MSVSASKSALLLSPCIRWAWEGAKPYEDEFANTTKRDMGTNFHSCMEGYYSLCMEGYHSPAEALSELAAGAKWSEVYEWVKLATAWSVEHLEPRCSEVHAEVYVATNLETGETHVDDSVKNRKYPDMPGFLPGTADLVCVLRDGSLLVADWKTGGGTGADKQLATLALGLRDRFRTPDGLLRPVRLAILYVTDRGVQPVEWAISDEELEAHRFAMGLQYQDIGKRTDPKPGIHCTQFYCDHLAYCPGVSATSESAAEGEQSLLPAASLVRRCSISEAPAGPEHAGSIMERVTAAKRQLDFYEKRIRQYCDDGGKCIAGDFEFSKGKDGFRWRMKK